MKIKEKLESRLRAFIHANVAEKSGLYGDAFWYSGPNLWEPTVLNAVRDLCKPGSVVFDVGGNMGGLTSAMSRLVGPRGLVCTFEASPRIVGILQANVVAQGHRNVTVYHRAVYSKSNEIVTIYDGDHLNDSIYVEQSPTGVGHPIKTLALDDFCETSSLIPDLIKMDIEGAEYEALLGSARLIEASKPHLILEQQSNDTRCLDFLHARGYVTIDLSTYRQIKTAEDYPAKAVLRNVLCVHHDRLKETPYRLPLPLLDVALLGDADFVVNQVAGITSRSFDLEPGRYVLNVEFSAHGTDNEMMCGVRADGLDAFRYHAYSKLIADSYREWVLNLPRKASICVYFEFRNGTSDASFKLHSVDIKNSISPQLRCGPPWPWTER